MATTAATTRSQKFLGEGLQENLLPSQKLVWEKTKNVKFVMAWFSWLCCDLFLWCNTAAIWTEGFYMKCCLIFTSLPGYSGSEDCVAMETLLQGYDEQDEDQVYRVCNSPLLKYMDNDVSTVDTYLQINVGLINLFYVWGVCCLAS